MPCGSIDYDEETGEDIIPDCPNCGFSMLLVTNKWQCDRCGYKDS